MIFVKPNFVFIVCFFFVKATGNPNPHSNEYLKSICDEFQSKIQVFVNFLWIDLFFNAGVSYNTNTLP